MKYQKGQENFFDTLDAELPPGLKIGGTATTEDGVKVKILSFTSLKAKVLYPDIEPYDDWDIEARTQFVDIASLTFPKPQRRQS